MPTGYRNLTTRVSFDYTIKPTLLLHIGVGYLHQYEPTIPRPFDENSLGLHGYFDETLFPSIFNLGATLLFVITFDGVRFISERRKILQRLMIVAEVLLVCSLCFEVGRGPFQKQP